MKVYVTAWIAMIVIVGVEVLVARSHPATGTLLAALLALALVEAAVALLFFMHLRYERPLLFWCVVPAVVFALVMMDHVWPDAFRLLHMSLR